MLILVLTTIADVEVLPLVFLQSKPMTKVYPWYVQIVLQCLHLYLAEFLQHQRDQL